MTRYRVYTVLILPSLASPSHLQIDVYTITISNVERDILRFRTVLFAQQPSGMEEAERHHRQDERHAVKHGEVDLITDNFPSPPIRKFDGSENGADKHPNCCNPHAKEHQADLGWERAKFCATINSGAENSRAEWLVPVEPGEEVSAEDTKLGRM